MALRFDSVEHILGLHERLRMAERRLAIERRFLGNLIRERHDADRIGRRGEATVTELADRMGRSRQLLTKVISGEDWA